MPNAAAIVEIPTVGGTVRVTIPAPDLETPPTGPGLAKLAPEPIDTTGEPVARSAQIIPFPGRVA